MFNHRIRLIDILSGVAIIAADIFVYVIPGMLLMAYEDNYDPSKGEYRSWNSMTRLDKYATIALFFWYFVNLMMIAFAGYKNIKRLSFGNLPIRKSSAPELK